VLAGLAGILSQYKLDIGNKDIGMLGIQQGVARNYKKSAITSAVKLLQVCY
jgi:hypothetical protein